MGPGGHLCDDTLRLWIQRVGLGKWVSLERMKPFNSQYGVYLPFCGSCMMEASHNISAYNKEHFEKTSENQYRNEWWEPSGESHVGHERATLRDLMAYQLWCKAVELNKKTIFSRSQGNMQGGATSSSASGQGQQAG